MDKNIIRQYLTKTFIQEAKDDDFPAGKLQKDILKKDGEQNTKGVKDLVKNVESYEDKLTKPDPNEKEMPTNKFNYHDKSDETYHNEMEIMNGQEMIQYSGEPDSEFKKRAVEAIEGSSRMGNNPEWANVVEEPWGGSPDFGKKLVKRIKDSIEKRNKQTPSIRMQGRDIQADRKDYGNLPYAMENENKQKPQIKETMKRLKFKKEFNGVGNALKLIPESYREDKKVFEMTDGNEKYRIRWEGSKDDGKAVILIASEKNVVNEEINKMKHLMNYKSEDTLGLVKGKDRITEDTKFADIWAKTKAILESEDIEGQTAKEGEWDEAVPGHAAEAKKHVEGSVSEDPKTNAPSPKEGVWDKAIPPQAADAKKHVEGSTSDDKGTQAPAPKEGHWDQIKMGGSSVADQGAGGGGIKKIEGINPKEGEWDKAGKSQAPEAKKHIEGSTSKDKGTTAPKPKEGNLEDIKKGQAPEAKKHVEGSTSDDKGTKAPKPKEGEWQDALKKKATKAMSENEKKK